MAGLYRLLKAKWFPPAEPTASFAGQTILITGANVGLGYEAALKFAQHDAARLILAVRTVSKGEDAKQRIMAEVQRTSSSNTAIDVWPLDMGDYKSIQAFAARVEAEVPVLDVAILNAGVSSRNYEKSQYGWEMTLQVNVLSTTLLGILLVPKLRASKTPERTPVLEVISSGLHTSAKFNEKQRRAENLLQAFNWGEGFQGPKQYGVSKLFVTYASETLAKMAQPDEGKEPDFHVVWVCPGACKSELGRDYDNGVMALALKIMFFLFFKTTEVGARTYVLGVQNAKAWHGKFAQNGELFKKHVALTSGAEGEKRRAQVWHEILVALNKDIPGFLEIGGKLSKQ